MITRVMLVVAVAGLVGCTTSEPLMMHVPAEPSVSTGQLDTAPDALGLGDAVLPVGEVDVRPVPSRQGPPSYPSHLRAAGVTGEAVTEFIVEKDGRVTNVLGLMATHEEFGLAAEQCIRGWRFRPAKKNGVPVRCRMQVPIVFSLSSG